MSDSRTHPEDGGTPAEHPSTEPAASQTGSPSDAPTTSSSTASSTASSSETGGRTTPAAAPVGAPPDGTDHTRAVPVTERSPADATTGYPARGTRPAARTEDDLALRHERAEEARRERFGGYNAGADFFGWLVAIALSVLLASIVGAVVTAVSANLQVDQTEAERRAGSIGLATAIALLAILMIGYYAGGYVAGRMSRFDGGRQGVGVWLIGLFVTIVAIGLGAIFGSQYNILDRVDLPSVPIPRDTLTGGGIISAVAILVGTLLAALAGGKVGQRYHRKVDNTGL